MKKPKQKRLWVWVVTTREMLTGRRVVWCAERTRDAAVAQAAKVAHTRVRRVEVKP